MANAVNYLAYSGVEIPTQPHQPPSIEREKKNQMKLYYFLT